MRRATANAQRSWRSASPGLRLLAFGASPLAEDLCKLAERFTPAPLVAPQVGPHDVQRLGYSGGTTGKPKSPGQCAAHGTRRRLRS